jgi:membrane protease YdiL (CAAX protease family)
MTLSIDSATNCNTPSASHQWRNIYSKYRAFTERILETIPPKAGMMLNAVILWASMSYGHKQMAGIKTGALIFIRGLFIFQCLNAFSPFIPQLIRPDGGPCVRNPSCGGAKQVPPKGHQEDTPDFEKMDAEKNSYDNAFVSSPLYSILAGPIFEEYFCRGPIFFLVKFVLQGLPVFAKTSSKQREYLTTLGASLISGIVFGFLHGKNPTKQVRIQVINTSIMGIVLARLQASNGLMASSLAHITNNALVYVLLQWQIFRQKSQSCKPVCCKGRWIEPDFERREMDYYRLINNYFPAK